MIKVLMNSLREFKRPTLLTPVFVVGEVVMESLMPFIIAGLLNTLQTGSDVQTLIKQGLILLAMAFAALLCGAAAGFSSARAACGFAKNLREDIFARVMDFSFKNLDRFSSASLVTRLTTDISNIQMAFQTIIRTALRCPLMFVFSSAMAYLTTGATALSYICIVPVLISGLFFFIGKAMPSFHRAFRKFDDLNRAVEEDVSAMRAVKGFVREDYEKERFGREAEEIKKRLIAAERIIVLTHPLFQACLYLSMQLVLFFGARAIVRSAGTEMNVGQLSAVLTYGFHILMSLNVFSMACTMLAMSAESARRVAEVLKEKPTMTNPEKPLTTVADGSVSFEHVYFSYAEEAERSTLADIDLTIRSGETVGIFGATGSGKTSLVQLICRLYDVTAGTVRVGGADVRAYDLDALRGAVAIVLQKNNLFSGTVADNLRWGDPAAPDDALVEACEIAQADGFIRSFPDGYGTRIEQGGTNVSGGQRQRLCIARALLKKPKILILDDATSAVDTKTNAALMRGLKKALPDTTKIVISQRIVSIKDADTILVLSGGKIIAKGTHDELTAACETYRDTFEQQQAGCENE